MSGRTLSDNGIDVCVPAGPLKALAAPGGRVEYLNLLIDPFHALEMAFPLPGFPKIVTDFDIHALPGFTRPITACKRTVIFCHTIVEIVGRPDEMPPRRSAAENIHVGCHELNSPMK
jgi:hypothetical protein